MRISDWSSDVCSSDLGFYEPVWRASPLIEGAAPPRFLPPLTGLVAGLATEGERLGESNDMAAYAEAGAALERVATLYVLDALRRRGRKLEPGPQFGFGALAARLGIAARHHRRFRRLPDMRREDGIFPRHARLRHD